MIILPGNFICQAGTLRAIRRVGLRPHGYDDGVGWVARVKEEDGHIAPGDHFGGGESTGYRDVLQPAAYLNGYSIGIAVESL